MDLYIAGNCTLPPNNGAFANPTCVKAEWAVLARASKGGSNVGGNLTLMAEKGLSSGPHVLPIMALQPGCYTSSTKSSIAQRANRQKCIIPLQGRTHDIAYGLAAEIGERLESRYM